MAAAARAAIGVELEQFAAQHVGDQCVGAFVFRHRDPSLRQPLDLPAIVGAGADISEHQMRDPLRHARRQGQRRAAAHRKSDQRNAVEPQRVQHGAKIAGEMRGGISGGIVRRVGKPMTALVINNDAVVRAQCPHLMKPHALAAGEAMNQHDRQALPDAAVVDADVICREACHDLSVSLGGAKRSAAGGQL